MLKLICVRAISVGMRAARLLSTHRQPRLACLSGARLLKAFDAPSPLGRSGLPAGAVGGLFIHASSVIFLNLFETATDRNT